jgi:hypothetical protein
MRGRFGLALAVAMLSVGAASPMASQVAPYAVLPAPSKKFVRAAKRPRMHQSQLAPAANKFHVGNGDDGKHYWLTPPALYASLTPSLHSTSTLAPIPLPEGFDGLTCEWGRSSYVNPPFGSDHPPGEEEGPDRLGP